MRDFRQQIDGTSFISFNFAGLFHKAIPMSGSGVGQFDLPYNQLHLAQRQARLFNCSIATIPAMMDCLRRVCFCVNATHYWS